MRFINVTSFLLVSPLPGCATLLEGRSQEITVITNPPSAQCVFKRQNKPIGSIDKTPGTLLVKKSKYDIIIKCTKNGYQDATYLNHSGLNPAIAGNIAADLILTLGVSSIFDSASGADNKYKSDVNITLLPIK